MQMEVRYRLPRTTPIVYGNIITCGTKLVLQHSAACITHFQQGRAFVISKVKEGFHVPFGDYQDMSATNRTCIINGEEMLVFLHFFIGLNIAKNTHLLISPIG